MNVTHLNYRFFDEIIRRNKFKTKARKTTLSLKLDN